MIAAFSCKIVALDGFGASIGYRKAFVGGVCEDNSGADIYDEAGMLLGRMFGGLGAFLGLAFVLVTVLIHFAVVPKRVLFWFGSVVGFLMACFSTFVAFAAWFECRFLGRMRNTPLEESDCDLQAPAIIGAIGSFFWLGAAVGLSYSIPRALKSKEERRSCC